MQAQLLAVHDTREASDTDAVTLTTSLLARSLADPALAARPTLVELEHRRRSNNAALRASSKRFGDDLGGYRHLEGAFLIWVVVSPAGFEPTTRPL